MCEIGIIDCIQINKKHVYKERRKTTHEGVGERMKCEGKSIVRCSRRDRKNRARGSVMEL